MASFNNPGGNITGYSVIEPAMIGKWISLDDIKPRSRG